MNSYTDLILKYVFKKKKRSIAIIIAIVLSVALITSVGLLQESSTKASIDFNKSALGSYHVSYNNLTKENLDILRKNKNFSASGIEITAGSWQTNCGMNISLQAMDKPYASMFNFKLIKGKLPQKYNEIVLEKWQLKSIGLKEIVGQSFQVKIDSELQNGNNTAKVIDKYMKFTLVGILKDRFDTLSFNGTPIGIISWKTAKKLVPEKFENYTLAARIKDGMPIEQTAKTIAQNLNMYEKNNSTSYQINNMLLNEINKEGKIDKNIIYLALLVAFTAVIVIYNIFSMSIMERIHEYGILRSIGTSPYQIRKLVLGEAMLFNIISIPIGLFLGIFLSNLLMKRATGIFDDGAEINNIVLNYNIMFFAVIVVFLAVIISALIPAYIAGKASPLESINKGAGVLNQNKIKTHNFKIKQNKKFHFILRFTLQNLWRHKVRFIIITISMAASIVVFSVFSYYYNDSYSGAKNYAKFLAASDYSLNVYMGQDMNTDINRGFTKQDLDNIRNLKGVKRTVPIQYVQQNGLFGKNELAPSYLANVMKHWNSYFKKDPKTGKYILVNTLLGYNDYGLNSMRNSLLSGKIDIKNMEKKPIILIFDGYKSSRDFKEFNYKVGDKINFKMRYIENGKVKYKDTTLTIGGILSQMSIYVGGSYINHGLTIVAHSNLFHDITKNNKYKILQVFLNADARPIEKQLERAKIKVPQSILYSFQSIIKEQIKSIQSMQIFVYGIILTISIISLLNILNAISTNLMLRTREFGMLRAIGLTNMQLKTMVRLEGLFYGIAGSILGISIGILGTYIMHLKLHTFKNKVTEAYVLPWQILLASGIASIFIGLVATLLPSLKIGKRNITDALKVTE
jgi:putative ABC transport system permease protein